ncbi:MAG: DoxX family membrane protein [Ginsengibacter sp.]
MAHSTSAVLTQSTATYSKSKAFTLAAHVARVILGLIFLVFGLNGFLHFIPMPPPTGTAAEFVYGLVKANYFLPFMAFIQVMCGILLLSGSLIPFALLLLFPITLNIFLFHVALEPTGLGMAALIMAANILLAVYYWPVYKPIFKMENAWRNKNHKQHSLG